jgi:hypothetical protein
VSFELDFEDAAVLAAEDEPGAAAFVGDDENVLIPEDGDVMAYGDGGAGKTTLLIDLAVHLAAGDDWLGIPVGRKVRVALVENEGPRPPFRRKLRRKLRAWRRLGRALFVVCGSARRETRWRQAHRLLTFTRAEATEPLPRLPRPRGRMRRPGRAAGNPTG